MQYAFTGETGQFRFVVLLGAEALPIVLEDRVARPLLFPHDRKGTKTTAPAAGLTMPRPSLDDSNLEQVRLHSAMQSLKSLIRWGESLQTRAVVPAVELVPAVAHYLFHQL